MGESISPRASVVAAHHIATLPASHRNRHVYSGRPITFSHCRISSSPSSPFSAWISVVNPPTLDGVTHSTVPPVSGCVRAHGWILMVSLSFGPAKKDA